MDTTFWGPSGHQLFHLVTYRFDAGDLPATSKQMRSFFRSVGHLLPCVYCRRSFQQYAKELPLRRVLCRGKLRTSTSFEWYYRIHNLINAKLRGQGYPIPPDPTFATVTRRFRNWQPGNSCLVGRDFLYAVTYQFSASLSDTRKQAYCTFFRQLAQLYPVESVRNEYASYLERHPIEDAMTGPMQLTRWFHRFDQRMNRRVCSVGSFRRRCNLLEQFHVKTCANRTCRRDSK